jgi:hypothetical protein
MKVLIQQRNTAIHVPSAASLQDSDGISARRWRHNRQWPENLGEHPGLTLD